MRAHSERRRYPRVPLALRADIGVASDDTLVSFVTEDVSLGGLRARGRLFVDRGEKVVVLLLADERIIPTLAKVVTSDVLVREGRVELRLQFEHISHASRTRLAELLTGVAGAAGAASTLTDSAGGPAAGAEGPRSGRTIPRSA